MKEIIQFKKERELGSILTDTFKFIRNEWKTLFGMILRIAGPALLLMMVAYIYYMRNIIGELGLFAGTMASLENLTGTLFIAIGMLILAAIVYYALLYGTVINYIKSYIKNNGTVHKNEVTDGVKENFWSLAGLSIIVGLLTGIGLVLCLIPGVYIGVVLALTFSIFVFEGRDVMDSISYSFQLIKNEWFITFATFLVVFLLYYFIMVIFQVPQYIYFFIKAFSGAQEISADPSKMFDWVYVALTSIAMIFQYLLYSIIVIATVFVYFNLNEKKNFTGTLETIDTLGQKEDL